MRDAKDYFRKICNTLQLKTIHVLVSILNYRWGTFPKWAPKEQITTIQYSEILGSGSSIDIESVYLGWAHSERIWNEGKYFDSISIKKSILENLYASQEVGGERQIAPFLSVGWGAAVGHIGSLGAFVLGQKLGIVPSNLRHLPIRDENSAFWIKNLFQRDVGLAGSRFGFSIMENPSQWHLSERLAIIRTDTDFISLYEMHETVYRDSRILSKELNLTIDRDYETFAKLELQGLGLPEGAWFVGLHIREKSNPLDPRVANVETFYKSIFEIVERGGWVIRFGADSMKPLPFMEKVIDLNTNNEKNRKLHLYILAKSKFLLTTNSGPSVVAWALGTPVLQTNTLSIGRNILSSSRGSIFLPKKFLSATGNYCSFAQILESPEAYSETNLMEKHLRGFKLSDNSEIEIWSATKDMFNFLDTGKHVDKLSHKVNDIRRAHNAVGYGLIAPSFLGENESWFLN